jgi:hypothetical protein
VRDILKAKQIHQNALMVLTRLLPAIMGTTIFQKAAALHITFFSHIYLKSEIYNKKYARRIKVYSEKSRTSFPTKSRHISLPAKSRRLKYGELVKSSLRLRGGKLRQGAQDPP